MIHIHDVINHGKHGCLFLSIDSKDPTENHGWYIKWPGMSLLDVRIHGHAPWKIACFLYFYNTRLYHSVLLCIFSRNSRMFQEFQRYRLDVSLGPWAMRHGASRESHVVMFRFTSEVGGLFGGSLGWLDGQERGRSLNGISEPTSGHEIRKSRSGFKIIWAWEFAITITISNPDCHQAWVSSTLITSWFTTADACK